MAKHQIETERTTSSTIKSCALSAAQIHTLLTKLGSLLPYSIPLLRRIEFYIHRRLVSSSARIFVAAVTNDANGEDDVETWNPNHWLVETQPPTQPWLAAYIDLVNAGQTQVWLFASWEADATYPLPSSLDSRMDALELTYSSTSQPPLHEALMHTLFRYISADLIPQLPSTPSEDWFELERTGKYLSKPYRREKVLFGTVNEKLWCWFERTARTRTDDGYWKFIFDISSNSFSSPESRDGDGLETISTFISTPPPSIRSTNGDTDSIPGAVLPQRYTFGPLRQEHLQTVLDRTAIPRTLTTLRKLVSMGIFHDSSSSTPIAWGFSGTDGSLSSLHTEEGHRGKGLAVSLGAELLRRGHLGDSVLGNGDEEEERGQHQSERHIWAHADVSKSNTASRRVMEKLGGKPMWMVMWTEVDMAELTTLL